MTNLLLIDITRLVGRALADRMPTGVDRVSLAYVQHFRERAIALVRVGGRWLEFSQKDSRKLFDILLTGQPTPKAWLRVLVARSYAQRWTSHRDAILFNTGHSGLEQARHRGQIEARRLLPIFFLHDLIPISHPEYCRPGEADRHHERLDLMLSIGRGLLMNSDCTRIDLENYAKRHGYALPPHAVAPLAPATLPKPGHRPKETPYFLMLGTIEARKNHLMLLHVWRQMVERLGRERTPKLILIGQRGWECEQVIDLLERCTALRGVVLELPGVDDQALADWLHHARALLFPSFSEGFGMPLPEALKLGIPVIASDLPVFREIAHDIPDYLNPVDGLGWGDCILDYTRHDSPRRAAQCLRMQDYVAQDWPRHFEVVETLLAQVEAGAHQPIARSLAMAAAGQ